MANLRRMVVGCLLAVCAALLPAQAAVFSVSHDADVAVAWFDLLYGAIQAERLSPPVASRLIGYHGVALYESLQPGMPGYRSLAGQLNGLEESGPRILPGAH